MVGSRSHPFWVGPKVLPPPPPPPQQLGLKESGVSHEYPIIRQEEAKTHKQQVGLSQFGQVENLRDEGAHAKLSLSTGLSPPLSPQGQLYFAPAWKW